MLDIGLGEVLLIAVLALLVFGPDRLPKVAADAARLLRQLRQISTEARRNLADAAGMVDEDGDLESAVREIRNLDPRRAARVLDERAVTADRADTAPAAATAPGAATVAASAAGPARPPAAPPSAGPPPSSTSDAGPADISADPDWT